LPAPAAFQTIHNLHCKSAGVYDDLFQRLAKQEEKAHEGRADRKGKRPPGPFPRFGALCSVAGWGRASGWRCVQLVQVWCSSGQNAIWRWLSTRLSDAAAAGWHFSIPLGFPFSP